MTNTDLRTETRVVVSSQFIGVPTGIFVAQFFWRNDLLWNVKMSVMMWMKMSPRKKRKRKPPHFANSSILAVELECGSMCEEAQHESIFASIIVRRNIIVRDICQEAIC
jgi:hypothetical protein